MTSSGVARFGVAAVTALREELEDLRDSRAIRGAAKKDKGKKRLSIDDVRAKLRSRRKRPDAA